MNTFLNKQQIQSLIDKAPQSVSTEDIINGLVQRGYELEGFNEPQQSPEELGGAFDVSSQLEGGSAARKALGAGAGLINPALGAAVEGGGFSKGLAKSALETVTGAGELGEKGVGLITGNKEPGAIEKFRESDLGQELTKAEGFEEKAGKVVGDIAQFFVPELGAIKAAELVKGGQAIKALNLGEKATQVLSKVAPKLANITSRVTGDVLLSAAKEGDVGEETKRIAILSAVLPEGFSLIGKGVGKVTEGVTKVLPEKLYQQIFKTASDDLNMAFQSQALGKELDPTLAREVLDRGLKGSSKNMAIFSFKKINELENQLQNIVGESDQLIKNPIKGNGLKQLLAEIEDKFSRGSGAILGDRASDARTLINEIDALPEGQITESLALKAKRFIDRMRSTSSFKLDPNLSANQEFYKSAADQLRAQLKKNKNIANLLNEERIFIQAKDAIIDDAVRRGNRNVIGLTDVLLGGGGLTSGAPGVGLTAAGLSRGFQQPFSLTNIASLLDSFGKNIPEFGILEKLPSRSIITDTAVSD